MEIEDIEVMYSPREMPKEGSLVQVPGILANKRECIYSCKESSSSLFLSNTPTMILATVSSAFALAHALSDPSEHVLVFLYSPNGGVLII
jgi:hypothetical protein